jgi:hypothetical protein
MEEQPADIGQILILELERKGIENRIIPRFIKDLCHSFLTDPTISLTEVNERLHLLGWEDVDLDYHTLQLAIASFERDQATLSL